LTYPTGEVVTIVSGPVSVTADVTDSPTAAVAGYRQLVRR